MWRHAVFRLGDVFTMWQLARPFLFCVGMEQQTHDALEMVTTAKEALSNLFTEDNRGVWYLCYLSSTEEPVTAAARLPPSSSRNYALELLEGTPKTMKEMVYPVVDFLGKTIEELLAGHPSPVMHNTSFWTNFLRTLQFELSEGLVFRGQRRKEEVCYELLAPLLGRVAHSTSQLPVPQDSGLEGIVYTSSLNYEVHTEDRGNRRGRQPQVDFTMSAHVDSDTFYCVPVEAKQKLEARDIRSTRQH